MMLFMHFMSCFSIRTMSISIERVRRLMKLFNAYHFLDTFDVINLFSKNKYLIINYILQKHFIFQDTGKYKWT